MRGILIMIIGAFLGGTTAWLIEGPTVKKEESNLRVLHIQQCVTNMAAPDVFDCKWEDRAGTTFSKESLYAITPETHPLQGMDKFRAVVTTSFEDPK